MNNYCEDCGCRTSDGTCSNCQEELYILIFQSDDIDSVSDDFRCKADEQAALIEERKQYRGIL